MIWLKNYVKNVKRSFCGGVSIGNMNLTEYIRVHIPIDDLFVFSGEVLNDDEDYE